MIARILVAIDASPRAAGVVDAAAEIARSVGAKIWLLRVIAVPPEFPPAAHVQGDDPLPEHMKAQVVQELAPIMHGRHADLVEATLVTFGMTPWREILVQAEKVGADLVVIGSHGFGGLDHVLGTTAAAVANHAKCNVLVVHERDKRPSGTFRMGEP